MPKKKEVPYCEDCIHFIRMDIDDHQCAHDKSKIDDPPIARNFRTCKQMRYSTLCGWDAKYFKLYENPADFLIPMKDINWPEDADLEEERNKILRKKGK